MTINKRALKAMLLRHSYQGPVVPLLCAWYECYPFGLAKYKTLQQAAERWLREY